MTTAHSVRRVLALIICVLMIVSLFPISALSEEGAAEEHIHDYVPYVTAPSCTQEGYTTYVCSSCGDTYDGDYVPASGHSWDGGSVTAPATTESEGIITYTCTVCGATETESIPMLEDAGKEYRELETLELEIPGAPVYTTLWVRVVDRENRPLEDVLLELVLPSGESAGRFLTDENGIAFCDLSGTADYTEAKIRRHEDDPSGFGPASPVPVALDRGSLVSIQGQTEAGFSAELPYVVKAYPALYTVTLHPNGGVFRAGYDSFEVLAEKSDGEEPYGYFPTDRFETYLPSEDFEDYEFENPVLEGYAISGWYTESEGGDRIVFDEDGNGTRIETLETDLYAHWEAVDYNILIDGGHGHGSVSASSSTANFRDAVVLTVAPDAGYELEALTVRRGDADVEAVQGEDGSWSFTMPADDVTVSAAFRAIIYSVAAAEAEHGTVNADRTEAIVGDTVSLTVTPDTGYELDALTVRQGDADVEITVGEDGARSFIMPAGDVTVSAAFKPTLYQVTVGETENGSASVDKSEAAMGETVSVTVTPDAGYLPDGLSAKGSDGSDLDFTGNAFTMPAADVVVSASFVEGKPVFMTHSLTLGGELGINFFMDLPEAEGVDYSDSYMTFSVNGETLRDSFDAGDTDLSGNGWYGFTCTVNALQLADEITAVFHYSVAGEEKTVEQVYTVETYLNALIDSDEISDEVKALARSLADYGYYSQTFLSDIGYWTIGTDHNGMTARFTDSYSAEQIAEILQALADQEVQRDSNANIQKITYSLYLDSKTSIYLYLQPAADYSGEIAAELDGNPVSVVPEANGRYRITIPDLSADHLADMHQVVVSTDGADPLTVQLSALSYVKACLEDENSSNEMIDAMAALYYYSAASSAVNQAA